MAKKHANSMHPSTLMPDMSQPELTREIDSKSSFLSPNGYSRGTIAALRRARTFACRLTFCVLECRSAVTTLALRAKRLVVNIVTLVAIDATQSGWCQSVPSFGVARDASSLAMSTIERKVRALVVVEVP